MLCTLTTVAMLALAPAPQPAHKLKIAARGTELTPALSEYANNKIAPAIDRYDRMITNVDLSLVVEHLHLHDTKHKGVEAHKAEITAFCEDSSVIRASTSSDDMYASVDALSDMLTRSLRKHKEKKQQRNHQQKKGGTALDFAPAVDDDDGDGLADPLPLGHDEM